MGGDEQQSARVGLCATCRHVEPVTTARGMTFYLCRRSLTDPTFAKYPTLPVRSCAGYDPDSIERGA